MRADENGGGDGNRTRVQGFAGTTAQIEMLTAEVPACRGDAPVRDATKPCAQEAQGPVRETPANGLPAGAPGVPRPASSTTTSPRGRSTPGAGDLRSRLGMEPTGPVRIRRSARGHAGHRLWSARARQNLRRSTDERPPDITARGPRGLAEDCRVIVSHSCPGTADWERDY